MEADISSQAVGLASSADFSLINLFLRADIIVKSVIVILIACSIYSWAIIIDKVKQFKKINISSDEFEEKFWRSKSAETFYNSLPSNIEDPMASLFKESMQGLLKSKSKTNLAEKMGGILEMGIGKQISKINAHEKIELTIKRMITNLTTKSARKKRFHNEKSVLPPKPTT